MRQLIAHLTLGLAVRAAAQHEYGRALRGADLDPSLLAVGLIARNGEPHALRPELLRASLVVDRATTLRIRR